MRSMLALVLMGISPAQASVIFQMDTTTFPSSSSYSLNFQLNRGGSQNATYAFMFGRFDLGGGSLIGNPVFIGDASGSASTQFTLVSSTFFNQVTQDFIPGTQLRFSVGYETRGMQTAHQTSQTSSRLRSCAMAWRFPRRELFRMLFSWWKS